MDEENKGLDEIFDLNPNPELYIPQFNHSSQILDYKSERMMSISTHNPYQVQEIITNQNPCSNTASPSQMFSYERLTPLSSHDINYSFKQETMDNGLHPNIISFARSNDDEDPINRDINFYRNGSSYGLSPKRACTTIRNPSKATEHVLSERRRRERMNELFISLSKVVPGLKKMDKATLLEDAIEHLKSLQERADALEELEAVANKNYRDASKFDCVISNRNTSEPNAPEIKARVSDKFVLIQICCRKEKGLMSKITSEMENMQLSVLDMSFMPFGESSLAITILAKMKKEYHGEVKDIVERLEMVFLSPA